MNRLFTLLSFCFLLFVGAFSALAQSNTITAPADGATGVIFSPSVTITVQATSTGNTPGDPDNIYIEVSDDSLFGGAPYNTTSDLFSRPGNAAQNFSYVITSGLSASTKYFVRAYSVKFDEFSDITRFTTDAALVNTVVWVQRVNGVNTDDTLAPITQTAYANTFSVSLRLFSSAANASSYEWQIDSISSAFTHVVRTLTSSGTTVTFNCNSAALASGKIYFVRARGINSINNGPWTTPNLIRRFVNSLHPCTLTAPNNTITRTAFKIWTNRVLRAQQYYFQVDDDPAFASPLSLSAPYTFKNSILSGVTGTVFKDNYGVPSVNGRAFDFILGLINNTTYYVRVRAWNSNQSGYWSTVNSATPIASRTANITNIADNAFNVNTSQQFLVRDDPNFVETGYDLQISRDNFATFDYNIANQSSRSFFINPLRFATTYKIRTRSYATGDPSPTAWSIINFTTVAAPALSVTFPTENFIMPNKNVYFYSSKEGNISTYEWQVEKLNAPTSSFTGTSATYGRNFGTYLIPGGQYRCRVRGIQASPAVTGAYSAWRAFTVASLLPSPIAVLSVQNPTENPAARSEVVFDALAFPNPFSNSITLNLSIPAQTIVSDLAGKILFNGSLPSGATRLGQDWPSGIYFVRLSAADDRRVIRIVKQ